ncbi:hypothetical protein B0A55_01876 [Friedmanniomyces simplex]|uniref:N-acetyltransferase domain-containing protein n=1 Tax=Friedmanniomyces simplex TaxID=329884 RepID=A0A4U0XVG5_9PEZI|nr:hypothetical protein B0A55_01876 [Friedmanniomyces simplex]
MPVQVLEAVDADMERIFEICSLAFAREEHFWDVFWPKHWEEAGRKQGAERMRETRRTDPTTKYMKAVDSETGTIMGMAKWNIFDKKNSDSVTPKAIANYWDQGDDLAYSTAISELFIKERNDAIREHGGNLVSLDICTIDPKYQRKGVGGELVKWGTQRADEMGVAAVVESSVYGKGLYEKHGYVFVKDVVVRSPGKWSDRPEGRFAWLVRPKKP